MGSMGDAKRKSTLRAAFLAKHPQCAYCGAPATTVDHCPPRCIFVGRQWPETYAFPACEPCNDGARLDDQAIGMLVRMKLDELKSQLDQEEWQRLARGVRNNQPTLVHEWMSMTRNQHRNALREAFGSLGDHRRREGWGTIHLGALTEALLGRFMVRLSKALYYRHNGIVFEGVIYTRHISLLQRDTTPEFIQHMLRAAPAVSDTKRANKPLTDQFIYRFNNSAEHGVLYAVVQFSEQFIFQLIALSWAMADYLETVAKGVGLDIADTPRHECRIARQRQPSLAIVADDPVI